MRLPILLSLLLAAASVPVQGAGPDATAYPSIQKAIDANPGRMVFVPAGDYEITEKLRLHSDNSGLYGPGRIIQTNPEAAILEIGEATGVRVRDLTLTRSREKMDTHADGIVAIKCRGLRIDDVEVLDNRTAAAAIALRECRDSEVRGCSIENYSRITVDDRTASAQYGYAFNCISGTGIAVSYSSGILIQGCRVVERNLLTTPEAQEKFSLGKFVKKNPVKGPLISQKTWDEGRVNNWHQGSGILVDAPEVSDCTQVLGNYIENAGQGMDIHADHVTIAQNIVNDAFIGMKAMHGSRNVIITGNQFIRNDLWAIGLMPGEASHPARDGKPANADGGSIVANNIVSDFGHGHSHWVWGDTGTPFKFDSGQEADDPPLTDVIIQGNVLHSIDSPLYRFAVTIAGGTNAPQGLHFSGNIFTPGTAGVGNRDLSP